MLKKILAISTDGKGRQDYAVLLTKLFSFFGSLVSIFLTRSLALFDMEGHGRLSKSISSFNIASNMPFSVSAAKDYGKLRTFGRRSRLY